MDIQGGDVERNRAIAESILKGDAARRAISC